MKNFCIVCVSIGFLLAAAQADEIDIQGGGDFGITSVSVGNQEYDDFPMGTFFFMGNATQNIRIQSMNVDVATSDGIQLSDLWLGIGGTEIGPLLGGCAGDTCSFSGLDMVVPMEDRVTVAIFANLTYNPPTPGALGFITTSLGEDSVNGVGLDDGFAFLAPDADVAPIIGGSLVVLPSGTTPEPNTIVLVVAGLGICAFRRRRT